MLKAAAYGVTAYFGWMVGVNLAPLGDGFAFLAGAAGLLAVGAAIIVRPLIPDGRGTLINTARWLSESTTRAFVLGASRAGGFYGDLRSAGTARSTDG